ncbi:origin recognition complex subunit 6 isoform X2 [Periplaneta americana]|uniref:origin recognition complex subunit 6 isoform X2 n=1 Tax=Periplaneta americana TaxID=6978 RepID=UPI0037E7163D
MASEIRLFSVLGKKLGLQTEIVVRKGSELHRLLQLKMSTSHMNISQTCQIVICLDLAASVLGLPFEKVEAIKLSGTTKKNYTSFHHTIEKLLGIEKHVTIRDLCVQFGVSEASLLAQKIVDKYVSEDARSLSVDLSHPMYSVAAVIAACKHCKLKVDRAKLMEVGQIRKSSLLKLIKTFEKYAQDINPNPKLKSLNGEEEEFRAENIIKKAEYFTKCVLYGGDWRSRNFPESSEQYCQ